MATLAAMMREWADSNDFVFHDDTKACSVCGQVFISGDVVFVYRLARNALEQPDHQCAQCGYKTIVEGRRPEGISVHILKEHLGCEVYELPNPLRLRIEEAFNIVDQIVRNIDRAGREGRIVTTFKARDFIKSREH